MILTDFYTRKKIQDGNIREFERLFEKYYGPLCHYADIIVKDMDTAEDLVQEFFYHFWKNRESLGPVLSLNAYLYRSIRNNALHHLKYVAVRKIHADHVFSEFQEGMPAQAQTDVELNDLSNIINTTLRKMPERCSRIFRMNRFEGMKYREIAITLSISVKTVESDMGKALRIFRKSLKEYTGEEKK